jgi:hypothetical protein
LHGRERGDGLTALKVSGWQGSLPVKRCRFFANSAYSANPVIVDNFALTAIPNRRFVFDEL